MTAAIADLPRNMQTKTRLADSGCWEWVGAHQTNGYGQVAVYGKPQLAHRVAYELLVGPIPEGLVIDHLCRNRRCVNPAHLEPVTNLENIRRGYYATKTECPAGHPYAGENLRLNVRPNGRVNRNCRECERVYRVKAKAKRQAAPPALAADDPRHGTASTYTHYGCRCAPCRAANSARLRRWRESTAAA